MVALSSFHLNPYDDMNQGPGEYSSKTIYTQGAVGQVAQRTNVQRTSLDEFWGHCIDGGAIIHKISTALTSILTQAMFSGPLHQVSKSGYKKRTFWDVFRPWESHPGMQAEWQMVTEGPDPPSFHPLFCI